MESNETVECDDYDDDVLLYYNKLIEVNCENVKKVTVNYMESEGLHVDNWLEEIECETEANWEIEMKFFSFRVHAKSSV